MSNDYAATGIFATLRDNPAVATVLAELVPFLPALKRMALHHLLGFVANLQNHKYAEAYVKLARTMKDDELADLPKRAAILRRNLIELERGHEKLVWDVLLRVAVALAIATL